MGMDVEDGVHPAATTNDVNATTHVSPRSGEDLTTGRRASSAAMARQLLHQPSLRKFGFESLADPGIFVHVLD